MHHALLTGLALAACAAPAAALAQATPPPTPAPPTTTASPAPSIPDPQTANDPVAPAMPADPNYRGAPYKGALTPPPPEAMNKTYPVCGGAIQDSCINPSAAREK